MLNTTDVISLAILSFAIWDGWRVGILRSALTPLCALLISVFAIINFDLNENIATTFLIVIFGSAALSIVLRLILFFLRRNLDAEYRRYVFWVSRLLGSGISFFWKGTLLTIGLLLISLIPISLVSGIENVQRDIQNSQSLPYIRKNILPKFPVLQNAYMTLHMLKDPDQFERLSQIPEFQQFFQSPKVKDLILDEGILTFLKMHRYELVLTHPKLKTLLTDNDLMADLAKLSRRIYEEKIKATDPSAANNQ